MKNHKGISLQVGPFKIYQRTNWLGKLGVFMLLTSGILFLAGCSTAWTGEAVNIIDVIIPAIQAALGIVAAFGVGVSPAALTAINSWGSQATNALQNVIAPLINQYNAATAEAKPGILNEIQAALTVIVNDLNSILPTIHVTDAATQEKIQAVIESIASELAALVNLVPAVSGNVTSHAELVKLVNALKDPKHFKEDFNSKSGVFGKQYEI